MRNKKEGILSLPPDLYSRNYIISEGIKKYKRENNLDKLKILDIGGRNGRTEMFLDPQDKLLLLDIREGTEENLLIGDATDMKQFEDGFFDIVISGDVFEHIPNEKRDLFVKESMRVAKYMVILAAPFDENKVVKNEETINALYKDLTGKDHLWLQEHLECGLPKREQLEKIISDKGYNFYIIPSNNLDNWILMQSAIALASCLFLSLERFYRFYNKNLMKIEDSTMDFYRQIYFISKEGFSPEFNYSFKPHLKKDLLSKLPDFIEEYFLSGKKISPAMKKKLVLAKKMRDGGFYNFYLKKIKKYIPRFIFTNIINKIMNLNINKNILKKNNKAKGINFIPFKKKFPESALGHQHLDGLVGLEIGGSAHNSFGLSTKNVDITDSLDTIYKNEELNKCGNTLPVDIISPGDNLPVPDASQDFVISSHVLEHFPDPIKALKEWYRVIKPGGYIFMIVPHKERTFDKDKERTTLNELIKRHRNGSAPKIDLNKHYSVWITQDVVDLINYLEWKIIEVQDVDDKVGNGFTIVIQK